MRALRALALILLVFSAVLETRAAAADAPTERNANATIGRTIRLELRRSAVPVLLPQPPPRALGPIRSIAVIGAGRTGYYLGYSAARNCAGGLACASFHVAGYAAGFATVHESRDRPISLARGERAIFRAEDCSGASCTEASLTFERDGFTYEIDAKGTRDDLAVLESAYVRMRPLQ